MDRRYLPGYNPKAHQKRMSIRVDPEVWRYYKNLRRLFEQKTGIEVSVSWVMLEAMRMGGPVFEKFHDIEEKK